MDSRVGRWLYGKAVSRIAYSTQNGVKEKYSNPKPCSWMDDRKDGWKETKAVLRITYSNKKYYKVLLILNLKPRLEPKLRMWVRPINGLVMVSNLWSTWQKWKKLNLLQIILWLLMRSVFAFNTFCAFGWNNFRIPIILILEKYF